MQPLHAQWPEFPNEVDQQSQSSRQLPPAGVIEMIAWPRDRPIFQYEPQRSCREVRRKCRLNAISQTCTCHRHRDHGCAFVGGDPARHGHVELALWALELPSVSAIVAEPHAHAAMMLQIVRML